VESLLSSPAPGLIASIIAFGIGCRIRDRWPSPLTNPLITANILVILLLRFTPFTVEQYRRGGDMITLFIVPATVILSLNIYRRRALLRANIIPILSGCLAGSLASIGCVLGLCRLLGLDREMTASLLPKSVTTAIALELSGRNGGLQGLALSAVILTGLSCAVFSPLLIRLLRLKDPVAGGIAMGTAGHAIGTAAALELGETEGALSGLAMALAGIITSLVFVLLF
jgi:putative effector of murein hydrolase